VIARRGGELRRQSPQAFNLDVRTRSLGDPTSMDKDVFARYSRAFSFTWTVVVTALSEEDWYRTHNRLALLHGDVGAGNIIWRPLPTLIDWEDWRIGDPAEEIAYIFTEDILTTINNKHSGMGTTT
jgi:thiamine kinase-like enzyme